MPILGHFLWAFIFHTTFRCFINTRNGGCFETYFLIFMHIEMNHKGLISWTSEGIDNTSADGCMQIRTYSYKNLPSKSIIQRLNDGMINLNEFTTNIMHENQNQISRYINSYPFQVIMKTIDTTIKLPNIVYLIKVSDSVFKIGRTHDFEQRYSKDIRAKADSVVYVDNEVNVEKLLINAYKRAGYELYRGKEWFRFTSFKEVKEIFDKTVETHKKEYKKPITNLIQFTVQDHTTIWYIDIRLLSFLIYKYIRDETYAKEVNTFVKLVSQQTKDKYFDILYDKQIKQNCLAWTYMGVVMMEREKDMLINISRVQNSICRSFKIPKKKVADFMRRADVKRIRERFEKLYPNEIFAVPNYQNKEQPWMNGTYLHWRLINVFLGWVRTDFIFELAEITVPVARDKDQINDFSIATEALTNYRSNQLKKQTMDVFRISKTDKCGFRITNASEVDE